MFKKKPWSDGLFPDFDDSFESRFYCFGGDGGGDSGSGGRNEPRQNRYNPADQEPEESRAAPPPTLPTPPPARPVPTRPTPPPARPYEGPFTSQIAENIYMSGADAPPPPAGARPMGIADMFPSAVVEPAAPPRTPESPLASFVQPKLGLSGSLDVSDMSVGFGSPNQVYEDAISLGNTGLSVGQGPPSASQTIQGLADKFDVPSSVNIGGYEFGFPEDSGMGVELGPGRLEPTIDLQDKSIGLNYKIDIAQQDPQAFARDQALADQDRTQLEYPTIEDRGSLYGRSNPIPVERRSLYEGLAPAARGITLDDIVGANPVVDLSDLSDSASLGNPYAGTTGAFVPTRIEVDAQGRVREVPVGFGAGGIVSLLQPLGDYLTGEIDQQRVDPFLEMVENAAYQEFGIDPSSGGGGMGSIGFDNMEPELLDIQPGKYISGNELTVATGFQGRPALQEMPGYRGPPTVGGNMAPENQMTNLLGLGPNIGNETVQPDFMQSALGYFGKTYDTFNADTGMSSTAMTPERMVQQAQSRLMQRDVKPKAVMDYLNNVIQTGGNPTMMAPDMSGNMQQVNLLGVGPGGGVSSGQALPSTNPYQAQFQSAFGGIGSLF